MSGLSIAESGRSERIEFYAKAERLFYFFEKVKRFDLGEVAGILLVEKGNIEMIAVKRYEHVRVF